jgi:hypothetical protein
MSNEPSRIEVIAGRERRRRYTADRLQLVEETLQPGMTRLCGRPPARRLSEPGVQVEAVDVRGRADGCQSG